MDEAWSENLTCPACGCLDCIILSEPRHLAGILPGGGRIEKYWPIEGRAVCRACQCEFAFEVADDPNAA